VGAFKGRWLVRCRRAGYVAETESCLARGLLSQRRKIKTAASVSSTHTIPIPPASSTHLSRLSVGARATDLRSRGGIGHVWKWRNGSLETVPPMWGYSVESEPTDKPPAMASENHNVGANPPLPGGTFFTIGKYFTRSRTDSPANSLVWIVRSE